MQTIKVSIKGRSYAIVIGRDIMKSLVCLIKKLNIGDSAYTITNRVVFDRYGKILNRSLKEKGFGVRFKLVPDSEKSKSLKTAGAVINDIAGYDKKKKVFIVALGGGVVGDLAGFIAAIYKRGIPYIQVPTTLLAQVDSSIGGKTAVDLTVGKNLVGAFYQPRLVFCDVGLLKTLEPRQIRSGLAEVIKYGIIKDRLLFKYLENNFNDVLGLKKPDLEFIVRRCAAIKADIVRQDEQEEKGIRTVLNFGHTIGHAIEAAGGYKGYNHGEAIALGMLVASDISREMKLIDDSVTERIESLIRVMGLPVRIEKVSLRAIYNAHFRDKKFIGARNRFVLIDDIGKTRITQNIPASLIRKCLIKRMR